MPITVGAIDNAAMLGLRIQRLDMLEQLIQRFMAEDRRQAIVTRITRAGITIFEGTYGTNTKPGGVKPDTIFPVASITKPVVSTLLLCLQEDGLVDLCDPVMKYLPEFTGGGREKICLWHFLTHTSGLKDEEIWPEGEKYAEEHYGLKEPPRGSQPEEFIAFERLVREKMGLDPDAPDNDRLNDPGYIISLKLPVNHAPRSHMTYCNYGYQKLKEVIDVVSGLPIDQFAQQRLFAPLGMKDTYWNVPEDKWDRILGREERCEGVPWINTKYNYENESGGGGLKTTVDDITALTQMILNGGMHGDTRILTRHSIREMTTNHNNGIPTEGDVNFARWGLGLNLRGEKKDDSGMLRSALCLDHGGWAGTKIFLDPQEQLTAVIFSAEYAATDERPYYNIYGNMMNVLYSAIE